MPMRQHACVHATKPDLPLPATKEPMSIPTSTHHIAGPARRLVALATVAAIAMLGSLVPLPAAAGTPGPDVPPPVVDNPGPATVALEGGQLVLGAVVIDFPSCDPGQPCPQIPVEVASDGTITVDDTAPGDTAAFEAIEVNPTGGPNPLQFRPVIDPGSVGVVEPASGTFVLSLPVAIEVTDAQGTIPQGCRIGPLPWQLTTGQRGSVTGTDYLTDPPGPHTGSATVVDGLFSIPAVRTTGPGGCGVRAGLVNTVAGLPTVRGTASVRLDVRLQPSVTGAGLRAGVPGSPTDVLATAGDNAAQVRWLPPLDDGGDPAITYTVTTDAGPQSCTATGVTECVVEGLDNDVAHRFAVVASNSFGSGVASVPSAPVIPTSAPRPPTEPRNIEVEPANRQLLVRWDPPSDDGNAPITEYRATAQPGGKTCTAVVESPFGGDEPTDSTACAISGLSNGTAYVVSVVAVNRQGAGPLSVTSDPQTPRAESRGGMRRVGALELPESAGSPVASALSPDGATAWFATSSQPGAVVAVATDGGGIEGITTLDPAFGPVSALDVDPVSGMVYVATNTAPARVVALAPDTGQPVGSVLLAAGEDNATSMVADPDGGRLYVGTRTTPARLVAVDVVIQGNGVDLQRSSAVTLNGPDSGGPVGTMVATSGPAGAVRVVVGLATEPARVVVTDTSLGVIGGLDLAPGEDFPVASVTVGSTVWFGTATSPGRIVAVGLDPLVRLGSAPTSPGPVSVVLAAADGDTVWTGSATTPGQVVKLDSSTLAPTGVLRLGAGDNALATGLIVPDGITALFGAAFVSPGRVVTVRLAGSEPEPPGAPVNVRVVAGNGQALVRWDPPVDDGSDPVDYYEVTPEPGGGVCETSEPDDVVCLVGGLQNNVPHTFSVRAVNAAGPGPPASPSPPVVPRAPAPPPPTPPLEWVAATSPGAESVADDSDPSVVAAGVAAVPGGGMVVAGTVSGDVDFGVGGDRTTLFSGTTDSQAFVTRLSAGGAVQWALTTSGETGGGSARAAGVAVDDAGVVLAATVTGAVRVGGPSDGIDVDVPGSLPQMLVVRVGLDGVVQWAVASRPVDEIGRLAVTGVALGPGGEVLVSGTTVGAVQVGSASDPSAVTVDAGLVRQGVVVRLGPTGVVDWVVPTTPEGVGSAVATGVAATPDGGAIAVGGYSGVVRLGGSEVTFAASGPTPQAWIGSISPDGTPGWVTVTEASQPGEEAGRAGATAVAVDAAGTIGVVGVFSGATRLGSGPDAPDVAVATGEDGMFVATLSVTGTPRWLAQSEPAGLLFESQIVPSGITGGGEGTWLVSATTSGRVALGSPSGAQRLVVGALTPVPQAIAVRYRPDGRPDRTLRWPSLTPLGGASVAGGIAVGAGASTDVFSMAVSVAGSVAVGDTGGTVVTGGAVPDGTQLAVATVARFPAPDVEPPSAPRAVAAEVLSGRSVRVTWSPPAEDGGAPVTRYRVVASPGAQTCLVDVGAGSDATSCVIDGLDEGIALTFAVVAINDAGESPASPPTEAIDVVPPPAPPATPVVRADIGAVTVTVAPSDGGPTPQSVVVTASPGARSCTVEQPPGSCVVTGLSETVAYRFTAVAVSEAGMSAPSLPSAPVTPGAGPAEPVFADVPPGAFFVRATGMLAQRGITTGLGGSNRFGPTGFVTRAQMAAFLWRMAGEPASVVSCGFADEDQIPVWARQATCWLAAEGITSGLGGGGGFAPQVSVTRAQMAAFLWKMAGEPPSAPCSFTDAAGIAIWAQEATCWLQAAAITVADPYRPRALVTRGEMSAFLYRAGAVAGLWVRIG